LILINFFLCRFFSNDSIFHTSGFPCPYQMLGYLAAAAIAAATAYFWQERGAKRVLHVKPSEERVVIVGCTSGIGRQLALLYAHRKCKLMLFARRQDLLNSLQEEAEELGAQAFTLCGDATAEDDVKKLARATQENLQGVDTLIICAGAISVQPFLELCGGLEGQAKQDPMEAVRRITAINYYAPIQLTQYFLPMLIQTSDQPNIIVVSSLAGKAGAPTRSLYAGSKHAVHGFFDSLRVEVAKYNVHIGLVCPGTVNTDLRQSAVDLDSNSAVHGSTKGKLDPKTVAQAIVHASDLRQREVLIPHLMGLGANWGKLLAPALVDRFASKKYAF
jgi:short-subunit dehydrogenase